MRFLPKTSRLIFLKALIVCLLAASASLLLWVQHIYLAGNFHTVAERQCYRTAQLSTLALQRTLIDYDIATVVNLRGPNPKENWYRLQKQLVEQLGRKQVDVLIGSSYAPSETALRRLVTALEDSKPPLLLHCVTGADRTGLAAAFYKLLKTDADLNTAAAEISFWFGHNPLGNTRCLDCMLDNYRCWLNVHQVGHSPAYLIDWVNHHYSRELLVRTYHLPREAVEDND